MKRRRTRQLLRDFLLVFLFGRPPGDLRMPKRSVISFDSQTLSFGDRIFERRVRPEFALRDRLAEVDDFLMF